MFDNEIMRVLVQSLRNALGQFVVDSNFLVEPPIVKQSYQPTQQGVPTAPTVFIHKIGDHRYGSPRSVYEWDTDRQIMVNTETQQMETMYQVGALFIQEPANMVQLTASDLVNATANILQMDFFLSILRENNIGIERITQIRQTFFYDDRDRQEASPSFDFTVTHKNITIRDASTVKTIEAGIYHI